LVEIKLKNREDVVDLDQTEPLTRLGRGLINQTCLVVVDQWPLRVKMRKTRFEQMFSGVPQKPDMRQRGW
jgi:hypothetical protein